MVVQAQEEMGEGSEMPTDPHHTPIITQPSTSQPQKKQKPRKPKRKDTVAPLPSGPTTNVADEAFTEENVSKRSNDPLLSGEDRLKLEKLMALSTNLQNRVLDLEHTKTTQALEIDSLKRRVKKLEKKQRSRNHRLKDCTRNGYIRNHKKTVKNGQARTRESEEYKKKPKIQSRSQKCQALSQNGQIMVNKSQQDLKIFHLSPSTFRKVHKWKWRDEIRRSVEQGKGLEASPNGYK
ncbi:hypothetical protein Tco_1127197 [Tanacetum coccineum]